METIILAGGLGTRLKSTIGDIPKPMAPVNGRPFLSYLLSWLERYNPQTITLSVGYKAEVISSFFGDHYNDIELRYCIEESPLGTGGAIKKAMTMAQGDDVVVVNGDTWFPIDINSFGNFHSSSNGLISIALKKMCEFSRYGTVEIDGDTITGFTEKEARHEGLINGGVYIINKGVFKSCCYPDSFSFERELLEREVQKGIIKGVAFDTDFIDIGIPDDYEAAPSVINNHFS